MKKIRILYVFLFSIIFVGLGSNIYALTEITDGIKYVNASFYDIDPVEYNKTVRGGLDLSAFRALSEEEQANLNKSTLIQNAGTANTYKEGYNPHDYDYVGWANTDFESSKNSTYCSIQGIVASKLVDGQLVFNYVNSTGITIIPTDSIVSSYPSVFPSVYKDYQFPFYKNSDGYYEFDSSTHVAALDTANKKFHLYSGNNTGYTGFFPLNAVTDDLSSVSSRNYNFTARIDIPFYMTSSGKVNGNDMTFNFTGDDDVWVFIDDTLVLDMGGCHGAITGNINFATKVATVSQGATYSNGTVSVKYPDTHNFSIDSGRHTLSIFYSERGQGEANFKATFNIIESSLVTKYVDKSTGDVLDQNTQYGIAGEVVTTSSEDISGYVLVEKPSTETYTLTENQQEVTYYYIKQADVVTKYIDENTGKEIPNVDEITNTYTEGDSYTTEKKTIDGYTYTRDSGNTTGTIARENIEVTYYYKKNTSILVKYIDTVTKEEIAKELTATGLEGDTYTTKSITIDGYVLEVTPSNASGTMTADQTVITYEYRKQANVVTKYIDENTGKEISTSNKVTYKEGDSYTTEKKTIDGYTYTKNSGNTSGTVAREDIEVTYYYKKNTSILVKHIDTVTKKEIADSTTKSGLEGDTYTTTSVTVDGYVLEVTPENASGKMAADQTVITYEYRKQANVVTKYIDENTGKEISTSNKVTYKEGDSYTTEKKTIDGYAYTKDSGNTSGTVAREDIEVTYYYVKGTSILVKYIDTVTKEEIADSTTTAGHEGDAYTTTPVTIAGYVLEVTPSNASGTMIADQITVTYEYRKQANVVTKYIDENTGKEISTSNKVTYKEGDSYTTEKKTIDGYAYTKNSGNTTGTVAREDIEVTYYYKKNTSILVKHIDTVSKEEIADSTTTAGLEGDAYTTTSVTVDGYVLEVTPENASGKMAADQTVITYEYRKQANVVTKYIDENTGKEISTSNKVTYKEGDSYTTEKKTIDGYTYTKDSGNTSGTVAREDIEVTYYYKKNTSILVKHIDTVTKKEIADSTTKSGLEGDTYTTTSVTVDGYVLEVTPENASGKMAADQTVITYEYRKQANVVTKYIDENTGKEISTSNKVTYKEGDSYTTEKKTIDGYAYTKDSGNTSGTVAREDIEVTYYYVKGTSILVKYIDTVTKEEIADSTTTAGYEGDAYTTTPVTIAGYVLEVTPSNASGTMIADQITVTYEYRKQANVVTKYIDENTGKEISTSNKVTYKEGDSYTTEKKTIDGYAYTRNSGNTTGTVAREDIEVTYYYKKNTSILVKHIDTVTKEEIADSTTTAGYEGDAYTTTPVTIAGYVLEVTPSNASGTMIADQITVTYEYRKQSNVVTKYIDEYTGKEISSSNKVTYKEGDSYTTEKKTIDGYTYTKDSENTSGTVAREDIEVTYYYKKNTSILVKHIDTVSKEEIADSTTTAGLEGDAYTTAPVTVAGYVLEVTPENAKGTMSAEQITVTYEYRKQSNVVTKYIDEYTGKEISSSNKVTYKEGDSYTTEKKTIDGYTYTKDSENTSGTVAREDIEVTYYYKKNTSILVKHIDTVSKEEIADSTTTAGLEGDAYTTAPVTVAGYVLEVTPENASGKMAADQIVITYEYRKQTNVVTKYIDENTGKEISSSNKVTYKEEDNYTTEKKTIDGYTYTRDSGNTTGKVAKKDIEVIYYYKKNTSILVRYIDTVTKEEIAKEITAAGLEGDTYATFPVTVDGYALEVTPENASGKMAADQIVITYEYRKQADVITRYIDENYGDELESREKVTYKEGESYTTNKKEISGYTCTKDSENTSGTVAREDIEVIYYYKKNAKVIVKYIDDITEEEILGEVTLNGLENEDYTTEQKEKDGYTFVRVEGNVSGKYNSGVINVTYRYRKNANLITKHIDKNSGEKIHDDVITTYKEGDRYEAKPQNIDGYVLVESPEETKGTMGREDVEKTFYYKKISGGLVVKYVDKITGEQLDSETYSGNEKDVVTLIQKAFIHYILVERPNVSTVELTPEPQEYVFYYIHDAEVDVEGIDIDTGEKLYNYQMTGIEGENYTTYARSVGDYVLVEEPANKNGVYKRGGDKVIYKYRKVSGGLIARYIDKDTGKEIAPSENIAGNVGDNYKTNKKDIEDYNFVEVEGDEVGTLERDKKEVIYYYEKKSGNLVVIYEDTDGNQLLREDYSGKVKEEYSTTEKEINGYRVVERPESTSGTYIDGTITLVYKLEKIKGKIIVNFIDEDGNKLLDSIETENYIDEKYTLEAPEIDGYNLKSDKNVSATYEEGEQIINIIYSKIPEEVVEETPPTGDINILLYVLTFIITSGIISLKLKDNK